MTRAITPAQFATRLRPTATDTPATGRGCQSISVGGCGCAPTTATRPSDVCSRLLEWERLLWLQRTRQAKRQHRSSRIYLDKAREVMGRILGAK